jgi:hypothetical protein
MCIPFPNPAVQKAFLPSLEKTFTKAQKCAKKKGKKRKTNIVNQIYRHAGRDGLKKTRCIF